MSFKPEHQENSKNQLLSVVEPDASKADAPAPGLEPRSGHDWKQECIQILKTKRAKQVLGVILSLVVLRVGINSILHSRHHEDVPNVRIVQPATKALDRTLSLPANVEAIEQSSLFAHVGGYLKKIYVDEGDRVKKGQLLAEIDAPDIVQAYHRAKAEFNLKNITFRRYQELLKERVVSEQEYDNVQADADEAKARFDNAAANLSYTRITAPFPGSIARRFKYPGDLITATRTGNEQPLFILVNEEKLRVSINIPQTEVANISVGYPVDVQVDSFPNEIFKGSVSRLDALLDDSTKTQRVLVDIDNPMGKLHAGMFASAILHVKHIEGAVTVPSEAVRNEGDKHFVYLEKDGKASRKDVQIGMEENGLVQVMGSLQPSDRVILPGNAAIGDGDSVKVSDAPK